MKSLKVLHISNDFPNSDLYKQLIIHVDQLGIKQSVYSAVRSQEEAEFNLPELSHIDLYIRNILYSYDRIFFRYKIRKIYKDVTNHVDLSGIDFVHAHSFYSDGAVALKIKEKFNIPFIVTFRHTAFNAFLKLRPDLKWRRNKILKKAKKVVFISPAYRDKFSNILDSDMKRELASKSLTIPNGLSADFLNSTSNYFSKDKKTIRLLYVGRFLKLKNIPKLIRVVEDLNEKIDIELTLVGGGGNDQERIEQMVKIRSYIKYLGVIKDRDKLPEIYRSHDIFAMVSKPETFGLVYIEALSQGIPIIHTKGEGVDGYFEEGTIAEAVSDPTNIDEIAEKVKILANRLDEGLRKQCISEAKKFDWSSIAKQYKSIYKCIN